MAASPRRRRPYGYLPVLILSLTAVVVVMGAVGLHYVEQRLVAVAGENLALAAAQTAHHIDRVLLERQGDAQMMARAFSHQMHRLGFLTEYVVWMRGNFPAYLYLWLGVTDADGRIVASSDARSVGQDHSRSVWFQAARRTRAVHVGDVEPYEAAGGGWIPWPSRPLSSGRRESFSAS